VSFSSFQPHQERALTFVAFLSCAKAQARNLIEGYEAFLRFVLSQKFILYSRPFVSFYSKVPVYDEKQREHYLA
jgi:hypothetical protein